MCGILRDDFFTGYIMKYSHNVCSPFYPFLSLSRLVLLFPGWKLMLIHRGRSRNFQKEGANTFKKKKGDAGSPHTVFAKIRGRAPYIRFWVHMHEASPTCLQRQDSDEPHLPNFSFILTNFAIFFPIFLDSLPTLVCQGGGLCYPSGYAPC